MKLRRPNLGSTLCSNIHKKKEDVTHDEIDF